MGADFFTDTATGKTAREAFRQAVEHAQYESGHGGYTGTIAEKHEYVLFALPARLTTEKLISLVCDAEYEGQVDDWSVRQARLDYANAKPGTKRAAKTRLVRAEKEYAKQVREAKRFWSKLRPEVAEAVRAVSAVANGDKWGPAAAVEMVGTERSKYIASQKRYGQTVKRGTRVFRFFGYASS
jgi:hypothetical protein